jgi:hypothetical protein
MLFYTLAGRRFYILIPLFVPLWRDFYLLKLTKVLYEIPWFYLKPYFAKQR